MDTTFRDLIVDETVALGHRDLMAAAQYTHDEIRAEREADAAVLIAVASDYAARDVAILRVIRDSEGMHNALSRLAHVIGTTIPVLPTITTITISADDIDHVRALNAAVQFLAGHDYPLDTLTRHATGSLLAATIIAISETGFYGPTLRIPLAGNHGDAIEDHYTATRTA